MEQTNYDLSALIKNWPSPIVAREEVGKFSGGLLNPRTMANQDAKKPVRQARSTWGVR